MLIGKETVHEYRGRGVIAAVKDGRVTIRYGDEYEMDYPYPWEFTKMLRLREYDPEAQAELDRDILAAKRARAEAYCREKEARRHG